MDKLNIGEYCKPNSCLVKYKVIIHQQPNNSLVSDLMLKPSVNVGLGEEKKAFVVKSNLNLISSQEEPCSDNTLIGVDCTFKLVCPKLLQYYISFKTTRTVVWYAVCTLHCTVRPAHKYQKFFLPMGKFHFR